MKQAMQERSALCWLDGAVMPAHEARISVLDHGLLYGDGVFEGVRFYRRRPFQLQAHLQRLERSARALALTMPLGREQWGEAIARLIGHFAEPDGYLRLVVTRGSGPLGLDPRRCSEPRAFVIADHLALVDAQTRAQGARVIIAATRRLGPDGLDPRIKSLNYLNHILARLEAGAAGADEAILLNSAGRVAEGSADNIFIVRDGVMATPPAIEGALEGVTRAVILDLARRLDIPTAEIPLAPYDLFNADECFLTGTGAELIPVREIDERALPAAPGPVFLRLRQAFADYVVQCTA